MNDVVVNLCTEIIDEMRRLGFEETSIQRVTSNERFQSAFDKDPILQRTMLTMVFYNVLIAPNKTLPINIRLALNVATDVNGWLEDMKLSILPFIKINESDFFPKLN